MLKVILRHVTSKERERERESFYLTQSQPNTRLFLSNNAHCIIEAYDSLVSVLDEEVEVTLANQTQLETVWQVTMITCGLRESSNDISL